MSINEKKVLIILGSPKSGISLLADCFSFLVTDRTDNQGLISKDSILIHKLLCQDIGIDFITAGSLPNKWRNLAAAEKAKNRIRNLLTNPENKSSRWIMADPFTCLSLSLWQEVFGELNITPLFVHIIRHPWEVAQSLAHSNNIDLQKGHLIWLGYNYKALSMRLHHPYAMVSFDQLLADPISTLSYIAKALGIEYSNELQIKYPSLLNFVQPNVRLFYAGGATEADKAAFAPFFSFYDQLRVLQQFQVRPPFGKSTDKTCLSADFADKQIIPTWDMLEFILKEIGKYEQKEYGKDKLIASQDTNQANSILYVSFFIPQDNGVNREKKIILSEQGWQKISMNISDSNLLINNKLKIVPLNTNGTVFISSISIVNRATNAVLWEAQNTEGFDQLILEGTVFRLPDQDKMVLLITGDDSRLILPLIKNMPDCPIDIVVWLKAGRDQTIAHEYLKREYVLQSRNAELLAQIKERKNNFISLRKHFDSTLRKEMQNTGKQIEAFMGIQSFLQNGIVVPTMHGWPISPDFAFYLIDIIRTNDYDLIIEFGSGTSTVLIAQILKQIESKRADRQPTRQIAFEHLEEYRLKTSSLLKTAHVSNERVSLYPAPLVPYKDSTGEYSYYKCSDVLAALSNTVKESSGPFKVFVLVDGPPGVTCKNARYPALTHVMRHFQHANIDILLDDYDRPDEKETVNLWNAYLDNAQIPHQQMDLRFEKGAYLLQINFNKIARR